MICPNCSSSRIDLYCKLPAILFQRAYRIELCKECGIGFTLPQPSLHSDHYEEAVRPATFSDEILGTVKKDLQFMIKTFVIRNGREPKNLLDVGCGNGLTLYVAQKLGLEAMGIEPSTGMYEFAKKNGSNVTNCYLEEFDDYHNYDLIIFNSVIEHLPTPVMTLNLLYSKISDEALVVFQQAVFDGLVPKIFPWFWYGWAPAEHYSHYTKYSFTQFVEKNGFSVIKTKRSSLYYQFYLGRSWSTWKTFIYSNTLKLTSLVANFTNRGDSLHVAAQRNKAWGK